MDYRAFLQTLGSNTGLPAQEARALHQVVGNDFGVDEGFLNQQQSGSAYNWNNPGGANYDSGRGQIFTNDDSGQNYYYGPQGISALNDKYKTLYNNKYGGGQTLGVSTGGLGGTGGGSGSNAEATAEAQRKTEIQRQISQLDAMLGVTGAQRDPGLQGIDNKFNESKTRLGEQRLKVNTGYDDQNTEALAGRTRGYEKVDNYANKSANSLSRIFQGANAGNSSVARLLAPKLVGQASDSRRLDVTETANQNLSGIKKARDEADTEFNYADQELENNRGYEKEAFEKGIVQDEFDKYNQKLALEQEDGRNFSDTQNKLSERTQRLSQLFGAGKFNPQYQVRSVAPQAVALNDYKVDPMALKLGQQQQGGSFYAPQLKKKQELRVR